MVTARKLVKDVDAKFGLYARLILWLFALLLLTRFSVVGAVLTVVIVVGQVFLGSQFIVRYEALRGLSALSRVGISFCLGATVSTFIFIFVVTFSNRWVAILGQVALLVGAFGLWRFSRVLGISERRAGMMQDAGTVAATSEEKLAVKWIVVVTLLGLSPDWFWPLPVAVILTASIFIFDRVRSKAIAVRLAVAAVCGAGAVFVWLRVLDARPIRPWFADDRFAEIFSFSLGRWGMSHNPTMMGESISYHWFSFAWVGALANLANLPIEIALTQFGPMVIALACAILGYSIARSFVSRFSLAIIAVSMAFVVDTERLFRGFGFHAFQLSSFSQFFSLVFGLAILLLIVELRDQDLNSVWLVMGVIFAALIGAKSSSGFVALFGLGGIWLYRVVATRSLRRTLKFLIGAVIVPTVFAVVLFFGDPRNGSSSVIRRPGWPAGVSRDLWDVYNGSFVRYLPILIFLTLALCGLAVMSLAIILKFAKTDPRFRNTRSFLLCCFLAAALQMWIAQADGAENIIGDSDNTLYSLQFVVVLCIVVAFAIAVQQIVSIMQNKVAGRLNMVVVIVGLVVVVAARAWKIEFSPSYLIPLLTSLKPAIPFFGSLVLGVVLAVWFRVRSNVRSFSGNLNYSSVYLIVALLVACTFISVTNYFDVISRQQAEWRANDLSHTPRGDYLDASKWISKNSTKNGVVAARATTRSPKLSELTNRKELAGFQITIRLAGLNSDFESQRRQILSDFTSGGDCESAEGLRANDVAFVLVDLTNPDTPDVDRCAKEAFRNETVVVYSLK